MSTLARHCRMLAFVPLLLFAVPEPAWAHGQPSGCLPSSLRSTLAQLSKRFGAIEVLSTHRPGARINGNGHASFHASCRAVDFNAPRGKYAAVVQWLKQHHSGGLGTYSCGMHHIHIDNGPQVQWHKCEG